MVKPASLQKPTILSEAATGTRENGRSRKSCDESRGTINIVDDPPDSQHIAFSSALCASMGSEGLVGSVVKLQSQLRSRFRKQHRLLRIRHSPQQSLAPTWLKSIHSNPGLGRSLKVSNLEENQRQNVKKLAGAL